MDQSTEVCRWSGDGGEESERSTGNYGQTGHSIKRIRNDDKHQKGKGTKDQFSKGKETIVRINIGGNEIEEAKGFCYLGSMIATDAKCQREIIKRLIIIGEKAF